MGWARPRGPLYNSLLALCRSASGSRSTEGERAASPRQPTPYHQRCAPGGQLAPGPSENKSPVTLGPLHKIKVELTATGWLQAHAPPSPSEACMGAAIRRRCFGACGWEMRAEKRAAASVNNTDPQRNLATKAHWGRQSSFCNGVATSQTGCSHSVPQARKRGWHAHKCACPSGGTAVSYVQRPANRGVDFESGGLALGQWGASPKRTVRDWKTRSPDFHARVGVYFPPNPQQCTCGSLQQ